MSAVGSGCNIVWLTRLVVVLFMLTCVVLISIGDGVVVPQIKDYATASNLGFFFMTVFGTLFNFIYIVLINLVLQAIISGLIIDAFSELRDENEAIEKDTASKCFICSIDRLVN